MLQPPTTTQTPTTTTSTEKSRFLLIPTPAKIEDAYKIKQFFDMVDRSRVDNKPNYF
jgi:hypothetical protein